MSKSLKISYNVHHQVESFFNGSHIQFDQGGNHFYCAYGSVVNKISVEDGQVKAQVSTKNEGDAVLRFVVSSDDERLIIAYNSGLISKFNLLEETIEREFKSIHTAPISYMKINPSNTHLATGSSDGTVKLWNLINHYCSHNLKGVNGLVSCIEFLDTPDGELLFCSAGDDTIQVFDLSTSQRLKKFIGHCSTVTDLKVSRDGTRMVSVGRDKIAIVWDLERSDLKKFGTSIRTIPVYESSESIVILDNALIEDILQKEFSADRVFFATIGEEGTIKFWDAKSGSKVLQQNNPPLSQDRSPGAQCFQMCMRPNTNELCVVSAERDIFFYNLPYLELTQQLQGHLDEILSACWFAANKYIAIACNSNDLKIMELNTSKCQHLKGHTDIVLSVQKSPSDSYCLLTCSKDCSILVWRFDEKSMIPTIMFKATGHTHAIYAVSFLNAENVFFSAGQDTTLKRWSFVIDEKNCSSDDGTFKPLIASQTIKAHDDRIDDIAVSPNDQLIATGSKDKTAKIFSAHGLQILATLKGHRRGIHAVRFSPVDQVIVTAADTTLRMWNLKDFTCIKTFQGHDCSVLNFTFLVSGLQLLSAGSDGNMKIWNCKTSECMKTIDAHSGNIWTLSATEDDNLVVTGGQDEKLIVWRDTTEEEQEQRLVRMQTQVTQEQDFMNYINKKKWRKALKMAIKMENQAKALNVIREILLEPDGLEDLATILADRSLDQINFLVDCCIGWSATAKNSSIAQNILYILIHKLDNEQLMKMPSFVGSIDQMKNLTEKSFNRYERLVQQATFVDFFLNSFRIQ